MFYINNCCIFTEGGKTHHITLESLYKINDGFACKTEPVWFKPVHM